MIFDRRSIIVIIVGLLITAALAITFAFPQLANRREAAAELRKQQQQVEAIEERIARVEAGGADRIQLINQRAQLADQILPGSVELAEVFKTVPQLALERGVTLVNFTPGAAQTAPGGSGTLMFVGYETQATGSLEALTSWMEALRDTENTGLLLTVSNPVLSAGDQAGGTYTLRFTLQAWYSTQPTLEAAASAASGTPGAPASPAPTPTP